MVSCYPVPGTVAGTRLRAGYHVRTSGLGLYDEHAILRQLNCDCWIRNVVLGSCCEGYVEDVVLKMPCPEGDPETMKLGMLH